MQPGPGKDAAKPLLAWVQQAEVNKNWKPSKRITCVHCSLSSPSWSTTEQKQGKVEFVRFEDDCKYARGRRGNVLKKSYLNQMEVQWKMLWALYHLCANGRHLKNLFVLLWVAVLWTKHLNHLYNDSVRHLVHKTHRSIDKGPGFLKWEQ